ncbi:MAG: peptidase S41 [Trichocoleus desertorum ATA4-8-CV12]|jgi:carboxyl-terminal processing protease|nr:peptidase S41 [Trichocoleus desertorum ATA4-8-CV12]
MFSFTKKSLKNLNRWLVLLVASLAGLLLISLLVLPAVSKLAEPKSVVFEQAWQTVNEHFFDPKFNGIDWKATRSKYRPLIAQAHSMEAAADIINQMLSELQTSHTRFYTNSEPAYYQLLGIFKSDALWRQLRKFFPDGKVEYPGIGIFTQEINGQTFISAILNGSPAEKAGLRVGDRLLSTEDKPYQPIQSFVGKVGQAVKISIQRTPDSASIQTIAVTPKQLDPTQLFLEAMQASTEVIEEGGKRIGYVHIWSYAGDRYQEQLERSLIYGNLRTADALILDLRGGWGGAIPEYLNFFTGKSPTLTQIERNGTKTDLDYRWHKPVVMLVNQGSRSGKEILAYGFQQYNIGPVIGSKTPGAVVGGRAFLMQDGSLLYLAVVDVLINGERLEGKGVQPDIEVPFQLAYAQGADPQKQKAIEVLLRKLIVTDGQG